MPILLKYLGAYPLSLQDQVRTMITEKRLGSFLLKKHSGKHNVRSDKALREYILELKNDYMRKSVPLSQVSFDNKLKVIRHALGMHTSVTRIQGRKLKNKREIRIASLFKDVPTPLLRMISVHELAHLRHQDHDKAFYQLCEHMEPDYHQLEFDLRLYLTWQDLPRDENQPKLLWTT